MASAFVEPGVFLRYDPSGRPAPVLVDVSRSGREYPPDFRSPIPFTTLHDNVSMYVEELYGSAPALGATLLYACFPNTYIDTNRSAADIDETLIDGKWPGPIQKSDFTERGLGLLKRLSRYGEPMQERRLTVDEVQVRLDRYHEPYHRELGRILTDMRQRHGVAFQVSCHCMSAVGAPTHADPGQPRADFNLGDIHGATCSPDFLAFVAETFKSLGHSVSINFPYYGGELTRRHSDPAKGIESIFIEANKKLFIDTKTFKKTEGFAPLKASLDKLLGALVDYARSKER
jgi:N-formylglutamate deformylase